MTDGLRGKFDLSASDPLLDIVVRHAPIVLFATDADGVLVLSRGKALESMGLAQGELVGQSVFDLYTDEPAIVAAARSALSGEAVTVPLRLDGIVHETMFAPIRGDDGRVTGLVGVATDVTERARAEEALRRRLYFDDLTGLPNRTHFVDLVDAAVSRARPEHQAVAVVAVRLAQFRDVADALGTARAEAAVRQAADRLVEVCAGAAVVGRLDSGRLAVLMDGGTRPSEAQQLAGRIVEALRAPYDAGGQTVDMQPYAGVAMYPGHADSGEVLVRRAEATLTAAARSIDRCAIYSTTRFAAQAENLRLLVDLERALAQGDLALHYQPLVGLETGEVNSVEALARWDHPELGPIAPDRFIALAESSGLIRSVTEYVLNAAARQASAWRRDGIALRVDVNISPRDLLDRRFVADVEESLHAWGVEPRQLAIEVTERAMVEEAVTTRSRLDALSSMGIHLAIDDFGTGHSGMSNLKQLPFHSIKIDRSFISGLPGATDDRAIVGSVISLARGMGRDVTAEGVETPAVWDALLEMGCTTAQGYHIARPMPAADVVPWLASGPWTLGARSRGT